ncbi:MAG: hypothetical protein H7A25_17775 [Leptospiraceae bacterium]|nr:hypothetical protein [Leptospiraceae bacterium]
MKKGICERCGEYRFINKHHIYPKKYFLEKDNNETVVLCLECHAEIHELLPGEKQEKKFYIDFTNKFIGLLIFFILFSLFRILL